MGTEVKMPLSPIMEPKTKSFRNSTISLSAPKSQAPLQVIRLPARNADGVRVSCGRTREETLFNCQQLSLQREERKSEGFHLRLRLCTGYLVVCFCLKNWTVSDFIADVSEKFKAILVYSKKQYFQLVQGEKKYAPHEVLSSNPYVVESISKGTMPIFNLILSEKYEKAREESKFRRSDTKLWRSTTSVTQFRNQIDIFFYLPNGVKIDMKCKGTSTLAKVREELQIKIQELGIDFDCSKCGFKAPGTVGYLLDENFTLDQHVFLERWRKRGIQPKIVVVEKNSAQSKKEKRINLEIGSLIGKPLNYTAEQNEITICRSHMAAVRYEVREIIKQRRANTKYAFLPVRLSPTPVKEESKLMVTLHLQLKQVNKTVIVNEAETSNQFLERMFQKYYEKLVPEKTAKDYILKIAGFNEFVDGDYPLWQFEVIRNILNKNGKPNLVITERAPPEDDEEFDEEYSKEVLDELLENSELKLDHKEINSTSRPWNELKFVSIWEIKKNFRLKVIGVENISPHSPSFLKALSVKGIDIEDAPLYFYVTAGLYHGGHLISKLMTTQNCSSSSNPRWYEWVSTDISLCNVPRAARVCFTIWAKKEPKKDESTSEKDVPLGWVNLQLFDYKHELRTGLLSLNMWPDEKANPIGTCVPNHQPNSPILFVEFDTYSLPVVFPTVNIDPVDGIRSQKAPFSESSFVTINEIVCRDPLYALSPQDKELLWKQRLLCATIPKSLPKLLISMPIDNRYAVGEMHQLLEKWEELTPVDALELLDSRFADSKVREFAVRCLGKFTDDELVDYLLQLIQVLKYEPYHDSALARFLLRRALLEKRIGHLFFWYLKSEMHVPEINERYGLLLEAFLRGCGKQRAELKKQDDLLKEFVRCANFIKPEKDSDRREVMVRELSKIKFPSSFQLPLDPSLSANGVIIEKCKYMDSKKLPLWLVFNNADKLGDPIFTIFKSGDDLRQDMLTLQMIRIMDKLWKREGLDFLLSPYGCLSTGNEVGMIEVVLNSQTTAQISKSAGGAAAAFKEDPLANWLQLHNPGPLYEKAVNNFILSCAGYCVATYVLGIGDRHNDNIMVTKSGRLFHIDFGHFLGNYKKKFGFKRERAPFVFTPDFAYVMKGKDSKEFLYFVDLCCTAYNILRKHASMFINLFAMMLSTGIPELTSVDDIEYLREAFSLDYTDEKASQKFKSLIYESLTTKTTQLNNAIHILAH